MRLSAPLLTLLLPLVHALTTTLTLSVPVSAPLPNPFTLPPSTKATLSTLHKKFSAPLSVSNTFVFHDVSPGSYLVDIHCATHAFTPLRLDVSEDGTVTAWETFRGNDWDNKGETISSREIDGGKAFDVRCLGVKNYFIERSKFNILSILKNPMILLGLVSMGIFIGMPYLINQMDDETRAEFEERQKSNPMNGLLGGGQPGASPIGNFDMAGFLAGSSKKEEPSSGSGTGSGNGGGKKEKGVRR